MNTKVAIATMILFTTITAVTYKIGKAMGKSEGYRETGDLLKEELNKLKDKYGIKED